MTPHARPSLTTSRIPRTAFTLVEILVVIAMVGVLIGVLVVSLSSVQTSANSAADLANQSQIIKANLNYATDNNGRLFHPRTVGEEPNGTNDIDEDVIARMWVRDDWEDPNNIPETITGVEALQKGEAWEYLGNESIYRSPLDPTQRLRSYSLNSFVGVNNGADDYSGYAGNPPPNLAANYIPCQTLSRITQHSRTMGCIIEQDPDYANNWNGFLVHPGWENTTIAQWIDFPAWDWNPGRITIAYMDGSTENYRLTDYDNLSQAVQTHNVIYDSTDYRFFRDIMLPGRVKN